MTGEKYTHSSYYTLAVILLSILVIILRKIYYFQMKKFRFAHYFYNQELILIWSIVQHEILDYWLIIRIFEVDTLEIYV